MPHHVSLDSPADAICVISDQIVSFSARLLVNLSCHDGATASCMTDPEEEIQSAGVLDTSAPGKSYNQLRAGWQQQGEQLSVQQMLLVSALLPLNPCAPSLQPDTGDGAGHSFSAKMGGASCL